MRRVPSRRLALFLTLTGVTLGYLTGCPTTSSNGNGEQPSRTAPTINGQIPAISMQTNDEYTLDLSQYITDTGGSAETLRFSALGVNKGLYCVAIDPSDIMTVSSHDQTGSDEFTLVLHNSEGLTDSQNVMVTVTGGGNECTYSVETVTYGERVEYRFMYCGHHFMTAIDEEGTFVLRPHPGVDVNGWGSSWYAQPFLPGAVLGHTAIDSIELDAEGIRVSVSGGVSDVKLSTYGTWLLTIFLR